MPTFRFTIPVAFDDEYAIHPIDPTAGSRDWFEVTASDEDQARLWVNRQYGNDVWCQTKPATDPLPAFMSGRCLANLTTATVVCPRCGHVVMPGTECQAVPA
jgi:hypothetical protein